MSAAIRVRDIVLYGQSQEELIAIVAKIKEDHYRLLAAGMYTVCSNISLEGITAVYLLTREPVNIIDWYDTDAAVSSKSELERVNCFKSSISFCTATGGWMCISSSDFIESLRNLSDRVQLVCNLIAVPLVQEI